MVGPLGGAAVAEADGAIQKEKIGLAPFRHRLDLRPRKILFGVDLHVLVFRIFVRTR